MPKFNYLALVIGAAASIGTAYSAYSTLNFINSTQTADGVVVATPIGPHHPDVVFTDASGNQVRFSANGDVSQNMGDQVTVRYRLEAPQRSARIDTFWSRWTNTFWLAALSACFILAGVRNIPARGWGPHK